MRQKPDSELKEEMPLKDADTSTVDAEAAEQRRRLGIPDPEPPTWKPEKDK
jgi:hypothetical protein